MKIQIVSDIITNSSSETFLVATELTKDLPDDIHMVGYDVMNKEYLMSQPWLISDMFSVAGINAELDSDMLDDEEYVKAILEEYSEDFEGFFGNDRYSLVCFEPAYEDYKMIDMIADNAIWSEFL